MKPLFYALFACLGLSLSFSCKKTVTPRSPDKEIDSFFVKKADGSTFTISDMQVVLVSGSGMDSIIVTLPAYTDKTKLTPFFTHKGKSVGTNENRFFALDTGTGMKENRRNYANN